jgi:hypothetical protein
VQKILYYTDFPNALSLFLNTEGLCREEAADDDDTGGESDDDDTGGDSDDDDGGTDSDSDDDDGRRIGNDVPDGGDVDDDAAAADDDTVICGDSDDDDDDEDDDDDAVDSLRNDDADASRKARAAAGEADADLHH